MESISKFLKILLYQKQELMVEELVPESELENKLMVEEPIPRPEIISLRNWDYNILDRLDWI